MDKWWESLTSQINYTYIYHGWVFVPFSSPTTLMGDLFEYNRRWPCVINYSVTERKAQMVTWDRRRRRHGDEWGTSSAGDPTKLSSCSQLTTRPLFFCFCGSSGESHSDFSDWLTDCLGERRSPESGVVYGRYAVAPIVNCGRLGTGIDIDTDCKPHGNSKCGADDDQQSSTPKPQANARKC